MGEGEDYAGGYSSEESSAPFMHQVDVHSVSHVTDKGPTRHIAVNHVQHIVHRESPGDVKVHHFHHVMDHGPVKHHVHVVHHIPIRYVEGAHGQYVDMQQEHAEKALQMRDKRKRLKR